MAKNEAYFKAEKIIEEARISQSDAIFLWGLGLSEIPDSLSQLTQLRKLFLDRNALKALPEWLRRLTQLNSLFLEDNELIYYPEYLTEFPFLEELNLSNNLIAKIPNNISQLTQLKSLNISNNNLKNLPDTLGDLTKLETLDLSNNYLSVIPETIGNIKFLRSLNFRNNQLSDIPSSLFQIDQINDILRQKRLALDYDGGYEITQPPYGNPFNSELNAAYSEGIDAVKIYLKSKAKGEVKLNETKLIVIGEGEVGKSCLIDALLDKDWEEHSSTHGIVIHQVKVADYETIEIKGEKVDSATKLSILLNAWDFGGQSIYRPTHQLFFSAPAVYVVVWKPRESSQAGQVKEWIHLVKRRAPGAKFLIVSTHGGPKHRQPDIDRQEMWDLFGEENIIDFFSVDSKPSENGKRKGIEELKRAIARVAAQLPEVGRSVPKNFADVRQTLQEKGVPYLPLHEVLDICHAHSMDVEIAKLFITLSHRLGHLTHYENDPTLRDIVILRPDWLATAMSYVLDDEETRIKNGLVNFSRLSQLWNDPSRPVEDRYPEELHPIFLRLMERFDLSYRVKDPYARDESDSISLIGQLVPDVRPSNLSEAWGESPSTGDIQQIQICRIVDANNGQSANAEGLFYQLIVRLHKYSLGRVDYNASVHWQRGLVLEDNFKGRAFLEHVGNDVRITVRSPYPEGLLGMLTREVKFLVESFWEGLRCDIMVPCLTPCGKTPGTGMFEVEKLMVFKKQGMNMFPCMVSGCNQAQNIDALLRNAPAATQQISLAELQSEFTAIKDKLDEVNITSRRVLSQVDKTYTDLLQVLTDEAKEGPRLFSFFPVDRSNFNPKTWIREKFRLVLWCEHSRLPLPALNGADSTKGIYDLELDREWFKKSAPYLKFLTGTLGMVLPVASSAVKIALDEAAYKLIEEQLDFGKSVIDAAIGTSGNVNDFMSKADVADLEHGVAARADGSTLRELHALLKSKDPGFGGLVRVMNKRQEFLWVHEKFAGEY